MKDDAGNKFYPYFTVELGLRMAGIRNRSIIIFDQTHGGRGIMEKLYRNLNAVLNHVIKRLNGNEELLTTITIINYTF